jgi:predicted NBD/HSP70 family sugar kinase
MPMIDSDDLKHGLLPVQRAEAALHDARQALAAAAQADQPAAREVVDKALEAFRDACVTLYGYVDAAVINAEAKAARKG